MTKTIIKVEEFKGSILMIGCGCIGQAVIPVIGQHIDGIYERFTVLSADEGGRKIAERHGIPFIHCNITPNNYKKFLAKYLKPGDLLLNLSIDIFSLDLVKYCAEMGALYVDTSIEPWPGVFDNPMLELDERTNFIIRKKLTDLSAELGPDSPTAIVDHGANPGIVSHFVKKALMDLNKDIRNREEKPQTQLEWAQLARDLNITTIQISERDTQASKQPKRHGEFVNTWSIDGFVDELIQPAELSLGTAEMRIPRGAKEHLEGSKTLYLPRPGASTFARSWAPSIGGFQGMLVSHDEVFSIADYFSIKEDDKFVYRPTVMFVYHPCDDALLSALELEGRGWKLQPDCRRLSTDIVAGFDELGVLLAGHEKNAYWYGSTLNIEDARSNVPYANATTMQVTAGVMAAAIWAIRNPKRGLLEADALDYEECLEIAAPYLGDLIGEFTEWTPLDGRGKYFPEKLIVEKPWQLQNIRSRQWYGE